MSKPVNESSSLSICNGESMVDRYLRAQSLMKGMFTKEVVLNSTVYPVWISATDCFWYERELKDGKEYRLVDANAKTNNIAFDHFMLAAALARSVGQEVNAKDLPITKVTIDVDSVGTDRKSIKSIHFAAFEKEWIFEAKSGACVIVKDSQKETISGDTLASPDGLKEVFLRGFNIWLRNIVNGEERPLTSDGEEFYAYGLASSSGGFSPISAVQARWSEDSKRIFTVQNDTRGVKDLPLIEYVPQDGSLRPKVRNYKVTYTGDKHRETLRLLCIDIDGSCVQEADYRQIPTTRNNIGFFSSNFGWWSIDNRHAYFVDMEQNYETVRVVEFDTFTGDTKIIFEEKSETQINLVLNLDEAPTFVPLPETDELLWFSERSGWNHLYLYDLKTGALKNTITQGDWTVRYVVDIDTVRREAFIQTAGRTLNRDPYYRDLCRVHLDTGELTTLSSSDHEIIAVAQRDLSTMIALGTGRDVGHSNGVSPSKNFAIVTRSRADEIPVSVLLDRYGREILKLETACVSSLPPNWQWPEPVKLIAADGITDIFGLVFRPSNFSPECSYPIISYLYNTADLSWVAKGSFSNSVCCGLPYFEAAALAELGFIVVQIDGRGTPYRRKSFQSECYGWVESASNLEDHVSGIQQLSKRYPYMDVKRVGIFANSGLGGVQGLLQFPDFYKVSVCLRSYDSRLMPTHMWSDRYKDLSNCDTNHSYPEELVENFQGKLLLIKGMMDAYSPPAIVFRLVDVLQKANKDFDLLMLPNLNHFSSSYVIRRTWDYLVQHLMNEEPPKEFKLTTIYDL